jgi:hypothetical protein
MSPAGRFYCSMLWGKRLWLLAGPFLTTQEARHHLKAARNRAYDADPWTHFYSFGVVSVQRMSTRRVGLLNWRLGLPTEIGDRWR